MGTTASKESSGVVAKPTVVAAVAAEWCMEAIAAAADRELAEVEAERLHLFRDGGPLS